MSRRRGVLLLALVLVLAMVPLPHAQACSCAGGGDSRDRLAAADGAFIVLVENIAISQTSGTTASPPQVYPNPATTTPRAFPQQAGTGQEGV